MTEVKPSSVQTDIKYIILMGAPFFIAIIFSFLWCRYNNLTEIDFFRHVIIFFVIIALAICWIALCQMPDEHPIGLKLEKVDFRHSSPILNA